MNKIVTSLVCEHLGRVLGKSGLVKLGAIQCVEVQKLNVKKI